MRKKPTEDVKKLYEKNLKDSFKDRKNKKRPKRDVYVSVKKIDNEE